MHLHRTPTVWLLGACLGLVVGAFLWFDNPTVDVRASNVGESGPAGEVDCSIAPWDAGLNDNREGPGGEHSGPFHDEVAAECYSANMTRFNAAVGSGVLSLLLLGIGVVVATREVRPSTTGR